MENKTENFSTAALANEAKETFGTLGQLLSTIDENIWDKSPSEKSWSVGQVMEHILKANTGFGNFVTDNVVETDRPIDEKVAFLKSVFLDFSLKMQSLDFICPVETKHDKQKQLNELTALKNEIVLLINNLDLSKTCMNFELPTFGYLTRLEWVNFALFHTQRHTEQIRNILLSVKN